MSTGSSRTVAATRISSAACWACMARCAAMNATACATSTSSPRRGGHSRHAGRCWPALRHSEVRFRSRDRYVTARNPDDSGRVRLRRNHAGRRTGVQAPSENLRLYASAGRGFETPTFNELGYRADGGAGLAFDLQPAISRNLELGMKWRSDGGVRLEAAAVPRRYRRRAGCGAQRRRPQQLPQCRALRGARASKALVRNAAVRSHGSCSWPTPGWTREFRERLPDLQRRRLHGADRRRWRRARAFPALPGSSSPPPAMARRSLERRVGRRRRGRCGRQRHRERTRTGLFPGQSGSRARMAPGQRHASHLRPHRQPAGPARTSARSSSTKATAATTNPDPALPIWLERSGSGRASDELAGRRRLAVALDG